MTKSIYRSFQLLAFCIIMGTQVNAQKFGYVNSNEILNQMPEMKEAESYLEALQKQLEKNGQNMVTRFQKDVEFLQKQVEQGEINPKQQQEEATKLEIKQSDIYKFEKQMVSQVEDKRNKLLMPIVAKVNSAISDVAKENGFFMIFEMSVLLYADKALDVTNKVKAKLGM